MQHDERSIQIKVGEADIEILFKNRHLILRSMEIYVYIPQNGIFQSTLKVTTIFSV